MGCESVVSSAYILEDNFLGCGRSRISVVNRIGHYEIVKLLGQGGMGEVYLARDLALGRNIALKMISEKLASDPLSLSRFRREATSAATLNHPNVCSIYEIGEDNGRMFLCMEYIEGESLQERLRKGPLSIDEALNIGIQIAEALDEARKKGIIHRDIKPGNIMLTHRDHVKILDFGLAKPQVKPELLTQAPTAAHMTETGITIGTPAYMSPEQALGKEVDHRTDLFSFGIVLYEMATGRLPFTGNSAAAVIDAIVHQQPVSVSRLNPKLPAEFAGIIGKMLEKDPERRFQWAHDVAFGLRKAVTRSNPLSTSGQTSERRGFKRIALIVTAVIILAVTGFLATRYLQNRSRPQVAATRIRSLAVLPLRNLSGDSKQEYFADGMTEELIATLSRLESVRVISRTSVMQYKNEQKPLPVIARELGVDAVVEGSVMNADNRVRITAQLIDAWNDRHLWAQSYERDLNDIFALQSEVAGQIASEINTRLIPGSRQQAAIRKVNPDAYQAYLRGLDARARYDFNESAEMFQKAVEIDPQFTLAHAWLSIAHSFLYLAYDHTSERLRKAKEAVDHAMNLQRDLPEAHLALGYYYYWGLKDYDSALRELIPLAKELPNDSTVFLAIGSVQRRQGQFQASIDNFKKASQLSPRDALPAFELGNTSSLIRKYRDAEYYYARAISLSPDALPYYGNQAWNYCRWKGTTIEAHAIMQKMPDKQESNLWWFYEDVLERKYADAFKHLRASAEQFDLDDTKYIPQKLYEGMLYLYTNDHQKALASFRASETELLKELKANPGDHRIHASLGLVYAGLGKKEEAVREEKLAIEMFPVSMDALKGKNYLINLACIYTMIGHYDQALDQIEYLLSVPSWFSVGYLELHPIFDPLRNLPRYKAIVQKFKSSKA